MNSYRVSAPQFFSLLYLSALSGVFMYLSSPQVSIAKTQSLFRPIVFVIVALVSAVPVFCLNSQLKKRLGTENVAENKFFKVMAFVYACVYSFGIVRVCARFDLFASSELFPGTQMIVFIIALIIVCAVLSSLGLGALSRAGSIFAFVVVAATTFVMISLGDNVDLLNFTPLVFEESSVFLKDGLLFAFQSAEIGTLAVVLPQIEGKVLKNYIVWAVLSGVSFSAILFFVVGTLGGFADTQLFPTYTAVTLAQMGLLQRMDALESAIWILCVVEKLSFYFFVAVECFKVTFRKVHKRVICGVLAVAVCTVMLFVSGDSERFSFISYTPVMIAVYVIPVFVLPIAALVFLKITQHKKAVDYEKNGKCD